MSLYDLNTFLAHFEHNNLILNEKHHSFELFFSKIDKRGFGKVQTQSLFWKQLHGLVQREEMSLSHSYFLLDLLFWFLNSRGLRSIIIEFFVWYVLHDLFDYLSIIRLFDNELTILIIKSKLKKINAREKGLFLLFLPSSVRLIVIVFILLDICSLLEWIDDSQSNAIVFY